MTRIEIINEIKPILEELNYPDAVSYLTQNDVNWLKENIKALEQDPCEDAISRESAMLRVREFIGNPTYTEKMFVDDLNALPSVTPQPCEDAISREMALDCDMNIRLNKSVITQYPVGEYDYLSLRRACFHGIELAKHEMEDYLQNLPSVAPQTIEQQPCEDCINRQMVLDLLNEKVEKWMKDKTEPYILFSDIMALPPVTPQPKTGRWILTDDDFVYCSECEDSYYPRPIDASWYYCPHCGAKMEVEE